MKFWKMVSIIGSDTGEALDIASSKEEWLFFVEWLNNFSQIVDSQDREKLDSDLPKDLVIRLLANSKASFFVSKDGTIRSYELYSDDKEIDAVEFFERFGGDAMEEVLERGSLRP